MLDKQIFFDPQRKRWKRLRRILDVLAVVSTLVLAGFVVDVLRNQHLPELLLPVPKHNYKALPERPPTLRGAKSPRPARRKVRGAFERGGVLRVELQQKRRQRVQLRVG